MNSGSKSTLIETLPNQDMNQGMPNQQEDTQLVDNILREIGDNGANQNNTQALNYQLDEAQVPNNQQELQQMQHMQQMQQNNMQQMDDSAMYSESEQPMANKIIDQLKEPLLVAVLVLVASLPFVTNMIKTYIPKTLDLTTGNINMLGLLLKSLFVGIVYYASNKFI